MTDGREDAGGAEREPVDGVVDVVVVGSGFGGAVVACRAAQHGLRVVVLERGQLHRPGDFPRTPLAMAASTWDPHEGLFGLFQLWSFDGLDAVVASGVGGGSLIYANVAMRMPDEWFAAQAHRWPLALDDLDEHYRTVEKVLGVGEMPAHLDARVPKAAAFTAAAERAGLRAEPVRLAVSFSGVGRPLVDDVVDGGNLHGVRRRTCRLCGECDLGCNDGAKNTLDLTYLSAACSPRLAHPARVRSLAEARRISPAAHGYDVDYIDYGAPDPTGPTARPGTRRAVRWRRVRARKVVVAAGSLGSTWLLLTNRLALPRLGPALGSRFSGNGDALGFLAGPAGAAVESSGGPVITRCVRAGDHLVEDGGHPAFAAWIATALQPAVPLRGARVVLTEARRRWLGRGDADVGGEVARVLGAARTARSTMPLLAMGVDGTEGRLALDEHGRLALEWDQDRSAQYLDRVLATMRRLAAGPGWRFRRSASTWLSRGITAHPLGGVPMGAGPGDGVVDSYGEVFGHPGLFVADGSVLPGPVGANPSLTIAALAERFATRITEDRRAR